MIATTRPARKLFQFVAVLIVGLLATAPAHGQIYTSPGGQTFTNIVAWNFAAGPVPSSNPTGTLTFQNFGTTSFTANNDLNFTLQTLQLNAFSTGTITLASLLNGNFVFANAAQIQQNGTGGLSTISAQVVLGSSATGLTVNGSGLSSTTISGAIVSNNATGAPITVGLTTGVPNVGVFTLSGANIFGGSLALTGGNLGLTNASSVGIFGNTLNTLTVSGGSIQGTATIINPITATTNLVITGGLANPTQTLTLGGFLGNGISGPGGVIVRPAGTAAAQNLQGINTYTGATTVGQIQYASVGSPSNPGTLRFQGAVGQATSTSSYNVADGAVLEINYTAGNSVNNPRINAATPINVVSGFVQFINSGTANFQQQSAGTLTGSGATTILANTSAATGSVTSVTFANITRSSTTNFTNGTFVFTGQALGTNAPVAGGTSSGNIFATQIGGFSTANAAGLNNVLVGGGVLNTIPGGTVAPGSTNISILPYGIGDTVNTGTNFAAGSSFVTYDATGVRPLTAAEYNIGNFATAPAATDNMKISASANLAANTTVNSVFFGTTGATISGSPNVLTITSGTLASNVAAATISANVGFGNGGAGEGIVTVVGGLGSANTITLSGTLTGTTLSKTGHGTLVLSGAGSVFSSDLITVNAGILSIGSLTNLGLTNTAASTMVFDMHTFGGLNGGLLLTGAGTETYNGSIVVNSGHALLRFTGAGNLTVAGPISGAGAINIDPGVAGSVIQFGATAATPANTFTGGLRLGSASTSTFQFFNDGNLGAASGPITINTTGMTVKLLGNWTTTRQIALEGALGGVNTAVAGFDTAGFNSTWGGAIVGGSNIFKADSGATPGIWTITSSNNSYTGTVVMGTSAAPGGTLALTTGDINSASIQFGQAVAGAPGTYTLDLSGAIGPGATPWRSFAAINTSGTFAQPQLIKLGNAAGTPVDIRIGGGTLGNLTGGTLDVQGFGTLVKTGTGNLVINSGLTFTGGVEVWGGAISISSDANLGAGTNNVAFRGGGLVTTAGFTTARNFSFIPTPERLAGAGPTSSINLTGTLQIDGIVSGGGGFEKTGTGTLYLTNNSNSFGGQPSLGGPTASGFIKVNTGSLEFNSDANLGTLAPANVFNGGTPIVLLSLSAATRGGILELAPGLGTLANPIAINRLITFQNANTNVASIQVDPGSFLQFNGRLVSGINTQVLNKTGTGTLIFNADASTYTGTLQIGDTVTPVPVGNVIVTANANLTRTNVSITATSAATFDLSGSGAGLTKDIGAFASAAGTTLALGTGGQLTFGWNNTSTVSALTTILGQISGGATASMFQVGTAGYTIQSSGHTFSGGYHVMFAGGLTLNSTAAGASNGALPLQTAMTIGAWGNNSVRGPTLTLDNTNGSFDRIADAQAIFFNSSELVFTTNTTTASTETIGSLRGSGYTFVTMTTGGTLNFADAANGLTRVNNGTFLFRSAGGTLATNLGGGPATTTQANILFGNSATLGLIGGGGPAGTAQISILPYAVGADSVGGTGTTFVTYDVNGIRTLQTPNEFNATLIGAGPTDNVRVSNAALTTLTLPANQTINSLILTGSAGNLTRIESTTTETLTVTSGAILSPVNNVYAVNATANGGVQLGINVAQLLTGAGNTQQLNVFTTNTAGSGDLQIGAQISTTGGLVKSGLSSLYLTNAANTYTNGTTVNGGTLVIDSFGAVNNLNGGLTLGGGYFKYRGGNSILLGNVTLGGGSANNPGMGGGINVVSGTNLTALTNTFSGFGGLNKDGTGVLTLLGTNSFSGPVILQAGAIAIDGQAALGTNSRILFDSNAGGIAGATLRFLNSMTVSKDISIISSTATVGAGFDVPAGSTVTLSGVISSPNNNGKGLYKLGDGNLTLTGANTYSGCTQVLAGNLILAGPNGSALNSGQITAAANGFLVANTFDVNFGGGLILDNTNAAGGNNNNRLPDPWTSTIQGGDSATQTGIRISGGEFILRGNETVPTQEVTNRFSGGVGTITVVDGGQGTILKTGVNARVFIATSILVRGTNLGGTPGPGVANLFAIDEGVGAVSTLAGARGGKDTPFVGIMPGYMGDRSATGSGTDLMTYDSAVGFRILSANEYTTTFAGSFNSPNFDLTRAPNIGLPAGTTTAPAFTTWTSGIKLAAGAVLNGSAAVNVSTSTILATGNATINVPNLLSLNNLGFIFLTAGAGTNLTVNSAFADGSNVFKYGTGTLTLTNAYYGSAAYGFLQGTTVLSGANAFLNPNVALFVGRGATLDLGGVDRLIGPPTSLNALGANGLNVVQDGTISLGANTMSLNAALTTIFTGNITGTGGIRKLAFSSATTTFAQPQSYTGTTFIGAGTLQLAVGGTLASSLIDIRGGTLTFNNADDNGIAAGYISQRIPLATPINLAGASTVTGNANTPGIHNFGALNLVGIGTITPTPGTTSPITLTFANLTRATDKGTLVVGGTNLGLAQSPIGGSRVFLTQIEGGAPAAALVGGGTADGTSTMSILPWAWSSGGGNFMTYGANGLRPLNTLATPTAGAETESNLDAPSGVFANIRTTTTQTLTAPREVNSLSQTTTSGGTTGAFDLTIRSGAYANTIGGTLGVAGNNLLTGAAGANTTELVVFNTAATTIAYNIGTSGGVTKHGGGALTLTGNNAFTGGLNVNAGAVLFTSDGNPLSPTTNLGDPNATIRFGATAGGTGAAGGGLTYNVAAAGAALLFNHPIVTNSGGTLSNPAASQLWVLNGQISGPGSLFITGAIASNYEINGNNTYTGGTTMDETWVGINGDSAFGNGGQLSFFQLAPGGVVMRNNWTTSRPISINATGPTLQTNGFDATWNGPLIGASALNKNGNGSLILTSPSPYTASMNINAGTVRLVNRGAINGGMTVGFGAQYILDDTGTHFADRSPDASLITNNNGDLQLLGNSTVTTEEVIGSLTLGLAAKVTVVPGAGQAAILRLGSAGVFTRSAGSSILFRGTNLGVNDPGTPNSANIVAFNPSLSLAAFTGGGGPAGNTAISIVAGAFGDTTATGNGTQMVTYDFTKGIRLLNATEYANAIPNGQVVNDNIRLNAAVSIVTVPTTVNALWLDSGSTLNVNTTGVNLTIAAGNILVTGSNNVINGTGTGSFSAGANAIAVGGPGNLTINAIIPATNTGGLIKTGDGTLTLTAANLYGGTTTISTGSVVVGNNAAFAATTVRFLGGTIQGDGTARTLTNPVGLSGTMTIGGNSDLTFSTGAWTLESASRTINVTNTGVTTINGIIGQSGIPGIGLVKTGPGLLVLTGANTYGTNAAAAGSFYNSQTVVNAGNLQVNNLTGSGTGGSIVVVNSGGTLSGTGTILPAQSLESRNTVTINSGGTLKPGTSPGILTVGSAVTLGVNTATVAMNAGSTYSFQYNGSPLGGVPVDSGGSATPGSTAPGNNKVTVNGALNIDSGALFAITGNFADFNSAQTYSFLVGSGTTVVAPFNITNPVQFNTTNFTGFTPGVFDLRWNSNGLSVYFNMTPVPEPLFILLACGGTALGVRWVRRRRAAK